MVTLVFFCFIIILCLTLKTIGVSYIILSVIFVGMSSILLLFYIFNNKNVKKYKQILLLAFAIRFICMIIDLYFFRIPHAGADDEGFYNTALNLYNGNLSITDTVYGEFYTKLLYIFFIFIGTNRLGAQFTTVITSMISIIYIIKILNKLNLDKRSKNIGIYLICFMPNVIFLNSILRRDTLITLLTTISIEKAIYWHYDKKSKYMILALLYSLLASLFHSALIFVFFTYLIFYFMYDRKKGKIDLIGRNSYKLVILIILLIVLGGYFFTNFDTRFKKFTDFDTLYESVSKAKGGSAYLTNMKITNIYQLFLYSPFKFVYFLFSPMPWDFRGIADMCNFLLDSVVYLYLFFVMIKRKKIGLSIIFSSFLAVTLVFSLGTANSGTATRHRYNVLPLLLINSCYVLNKSNDGNKEKLIE